MARHQKNNLLILIGFIFLASGAGLAWAMDSPAPDPTGMDMLGKGGPISVTADTLVVHQAQGSAEFSGNVTAVQDTTTVHADKMIIWYKTNSKASSNAKPAEQGAIEKLQALSKVTIKTPNFTAFSDTATYTAPNRQLTLEGNPAKLNRGNDTVTGSVIIREADGTIRVKGRVQGIFHTQ